MTKSTITREESVQAVFDLKVGYTLELADIEILKRVARMALAAMDSEPVAYAWVSRSGKKHLTRCEPEQWRDAVILTPLYRHAQPAPVVPDAATAIRACLSEFPESARDIVEECADIAENACRAAMLQAEPVTTASKSTNSPVIPDGYVMVSKEPTEAMINAWLSEIANWRGHVAGYKAMLAAAPQLPGSEPATVPGKWTPVSEQMPEVGDIVLTAMEGVVNVGEMECSTANCRFFTSVFSGRELPATHWMPLPAAPQEVKSE
ncbi:DUF551 domain-containing protein [Klebsiella aerogenes]